MRRTRSSATSRPPGARSSAASRSIPGAWRRPAQRSPTSRRRAGQRRMVKARGSSCVVELVPGERRRRAGVVAGARAVGAGQRLADARSAGSRCRPSSDRACLTVRSTVAASGCWSATNDATSWQNSIRRLERACRGAAAGRCAGRARPRSSASPAMPSASSSSRTQRATSRTRENGASSIGSRSMAAKSISLRRLRAREPRVLRDDRQLDHVEQRRQAAADEAGRDVVVDGIALARTPRGTVVGRAVLVEGVPVDAVGQALHDQRPIAHHRQQERRDLEVVAEQIALGEPQLGPQRLVQIPELERAAVRAAPACRCPRNQRLERGEICAGFARQLGIGRRRRRAAASARRPGVTALGRAGTTA